MFTQQWLVKISESKYLTNSMQASKDIKSLWCEQKERKYNFNTSYCT